MKARILLSMSRRNLSLIVAILLLAAVMLPGALPASADSITGDFEALTFSPGNVNGQDGWSMTGPYDVAVVANTYGYRHLDHKVCVSLML